VVLLLLVAAGIVLVVTVGGWKNLQGAKVISIAYVLIYVAMAYFVARWRRGVLPLTAALSIILAVFAAIAAFGSGSWFDRDNSGYDHSGLPPDLIGLLCIILLPVLFLLIVFAMRGFAQQWNVEIEMTPEELEQRRRREGGGGGSYHPPQPQVQ
jgi:lysylphosphatidylglycerol synthetase-like protein (DUF2156 family)